MAQLIIFLLGWPLEWSEIIIIFVPIFLPLLPHFGIDPLFFGILVALNLQTSFLTPPMAMAAYYLKAVAPRHVQLIQIFKGCMPFLSMVFLAMILLYTFPEIALVAAEARLRPLNRCACRCFAMPKDDAMTPARAVRRRSGAYARKTRRRRSPVEALVTAPV